MCARTKIGSRQTRSILNIAPSFSPKLPSVGNGRSDPSRDVNNLLGVLHQDSWTAAVPSKNSALRRARMWPKAITYMRPKAVMWPKAIMRRHRPWLHLPLK